jgi:hypothetical protein
LTRLYRVIQEEISIFREVILSFIVGKKVQKYTCLILCFIDSASLYNLANETKLVYNFYLYALFLFSTYFGRYVPIVRRIYCINATPGICHSVLMTVSYAGWVGTSSITTCIPDGHQHRLANTKCRNDTVNSPDDGHIAPETCTE